MEKVRECGLISSRDEMTEEVKIYIEYEDVESHPGLNGCLFVE